MKNSESRERLILENQKLIHYLVQKAGIAPNSIEYDDMVSIGQIGLIKAVDAFDESKEIKFATFAGRCINNEIYMHFRKANKYANDISIDEPIGKDGEGNAITVGEKIEHTNSYFVEKIENKEIFTKMLSIILNYLKSRERTVILYQMGGMRQEKIAKELMYTRSNISKMEKNIAYEISKLIDQKISYKEIFKVEVINETFKVSFLENEKSNINTIFFDFFKKTDFISKLSNFKISYIDNLVVIQLPIDRESFIMIAQIMNQIN